MTETTRTFRPLLGTLPAPARRRVAAVALGWVLVALTEVAAYTVLALAIRDGWGVAPVLAAASVALVVTVVVTRSGYLAGAFIAGDLYESLGATLARAKLSWFGSGNRSLVTQVAGWAIPSLMGVPAHQLQTLILAPLIPLASVGAIWFVIGGGEALLVAALLVVALTAQVFAQRSLARADAARHESEAAATAATLELVEHLELMRVTAGPAGALHRAERAWGAAERDMAATNGAAAPATFISALAAAAPLAGVLCLLGFAPQGFAPATALALVILTARASAPIDDLALIGIAITDTRASLGAYASVAAAPSLPAAAKPERAEGNRIELAQAGQDGRLRPVSATIDEASRVHIAGPSGAGKSTLLGLIMRFDDPTTGAVRLGGAPLTSLGEGEITSRIAYVPQEPTVFTGTLAENIRLGDPEASDDEVLRAAHDACLGEVLARDPEGLSQQVGTRGERLSGGERQRVAIARALVKQAPIVVLDEATAALDEATERRVAEAFSARESTLLIVTHRDPAVWRPTHTITLDERADLA
ncbi:ATP-binding cassette domain-containing protein [Leucobacter chinensis]|uniref:ATP-binding cassette domain-containing protein n=1 Tax=Leucobacter chinensis TaxID=2851010 RepID=UPI001C24FE03|nr:ATP-binding cassette domain-containing protein [Leucobacter chinensis]